MNKWCLDISFLFSCSSSNHPRNVAMSLEPPTPIKLNGRTLKSYDPGGLLAPGGVIFFSFFFFCIIVLGREIPCANTRIQGFPLRRCRLSPAACPPSKEFHFIGHRLFMFWLISPPAESFVDFCVEKSALICNFLYLHVSC